MDGDMGFEQPESRHHYQKPGMMLSSTSEVRDALMASDNGEGPFESHLTGKRHVTCCCLLPPAYPARKSV